MGTNNVALPYSNPLGFGGAERRGPRRYGDDVKIKAQRNLTWQEVQRKELLLFGFTKKGLNEFKKGQKIQSNIQ